MNSIPENTRFNENSERQLEEKSLNSEQKKITANHPISPYKAHSSDSKICLFMVKKGSSKASYSSGRSIVVVHYHDVNRRFPTNFEPFEWQNMFSTKNSQNVTRLHFSEYFLCYSNSLIFSWCFMSTNRAFMPSESAFSSQKCFKILANIFSFFMKHKRRL